MYNQKNIICTLGSGSSALSVAWQTWPLASRTLIVQRRRLTSKLGVKLGPSVGFTARLQPQHRSNWGVEGDSGLGFQSIQSR